ncbi:MAG: glycosyltransferase [Ignavibacteriales bacterium]|nr:glycosyltransferase [Ignavibacteriales bacterium]
MKISIITPTYNSEKTVNDCVNSVLKQSYKNYEHIVIDNISTDQTLRIIKDAYLSKNMLDNLRIISEKDDGISDAFNKGINAASGEILAILNSDDEYYSEDVFELVVNEFSKSNVLFVHGNIIFKDALYGSNIRKPLLCDVRKAMPYNHPTMFLRKDIYKMIGVFNTNYRYAMDFDLAVRLNKHISNSTFRATYLNSKSLVVMNAGGASWANEIKSVHETKQILIEHNLWDIKARINYYLRILRTRLKRIINLFDLNIIVKMWRKIKWS